MFVLKYYKYQQFKKIMTIQTEITNLEDLAPANHIYREFTKLIDLDKIINKRSLH
ncbi:hypothetical protein [uncultured Gammaproteobacteria bacterium]|jgi:hypothetical protein|uniref:Uncharacterized protein n=2 Tax=sulfur-oxidizing symbionts TaxID=32036 RepID=A0ACA8ZSJ5_9GAMM|nr:hypothetical protein AZO1586R_1711 [Bathymodiolus azoricus thioautotrophic gill symbiont]CAB5505713.1 hypothetical protein AZO1586I_1499 [Bathymodiolus thermophilus thioautotrophic gill symbiont]CAC5821606.1 hypothetical protein [uncultured Gammaproteobacteria bacterium]CAC9485943.1 hypothetical protein [uncultured Gammaproteobacteria bacterium]CAC9498494.1 hypothetical protein [uncultured Gammaproteobacteria bacterium]